MRETVRHRYDALVRSGEIVSDPQQRDLADRLDRIAGELAAHSTRHRFDWLRPFRSARPSAPRGLYVWGGVGRGKTFLMDLFFAALETDRKRRVHFHQFMGEVHDQIARLRSDAKFEDAGGNPIPKVAEIIADDVDMLCFDEFAVYDIADAMILGRLFEQLFARGVTVVATSNVAPGDLYRDGLNRALFLPFIALLEQHMEVVHLDAARDYRLDGPGSGQRYLVPPGPPADAVLAAHFRHFSGRDRGDRMEIAHKGRHIRVPEAAGKVARFTFGDLCSQPLGAGDYLKLAEIFLTFIVSDVPVMTLARRNEAKRFIALVDTLYDRHRRVVISAEAEPEELWRGSEGTEAFEFARTSSRLIEMRSDAYWEAMPDAETKKARVETRAFE